MISRSSRLRITIPLLVALIVALTPPAYAGTSMPAPAKTTASSPVFRSISVSKAAVNAGETVTVDVYADNGGSPLVYGSVTWESPSGQWIDSDLEYDEAAGKLTGSFAVSKYAEAGEWTCISITLSNENGDFADIVDEETLGGASLTIINNHPDITAPSVNSIVASPAQLQAGEQIKIAIKATDDLSGVKSGAIMYSDGSKRLLSPSIDVQLEYNKAKGVLEGTAVVPDDAPVGEWVLDTLVISDNAGNEAFLTDTDLKDRGADISKAKFTVSAVKTTVNDVVQPIILSPTSGDRFVLQLADENPKQPGFQITVSGLAAPGYKVELVSGGKTIAKANTAFLGTGWTAQITVNGEPSDIYAIAIAPNGKKSDKTGAVTRAQAVKLIVKSTGLELETKHHGFFKDVPASNPYWKYIESAVSHSLIGTDAAGMFKPNDPISRGGFTQWLYNSTIQIVEGEPSEDTGSAPAASLSYEPYFVDVPESSTYAEAITAMFAMNEISGNPNGTFKPNDRLSASLKLTGFANTRLSDVRSSDWCAPYIFDLMLHGTVTGYKGGIFMPRQTVTRAEFAKMLCKVKGWTVSETQAADCVDVPPSHWAYSYVKTLRQNGVVDGYACNTFKADQALSRAEAVKMIVKAQGLKLDTTSDTFPDSIGHWASDYILTAKRHNLITGYPDGLFQPDGTITRAEAAKIIWQLL